MDSLDLDLPIERHASTDSTSLVARRAIHSPAPVDRGRVIVADTQTTGRGRFGRQWSSPAGGLWCTILWPVKSRDPSRVLDGLGLRVGLALLHAIDHEIAAHGKHVRAAIKWPNDILIDGRKVAGALVEVVEERGLTFILVGVGVNANFDPAALPPDLRSTATSLRAALGADVRLDRLLDNLRRRVRDALLDEGIDPRRLADLRARLHGVGEPARVTMPDRSVRTGVLVGLSDEGRLLLRDHDGRVQPLPPGVELAGATGAATAS